MKQMALDIGLSAGPTLNNFWIGPNAAAHRHLQLWVGASTGAASVRSPVPTYLWGLPGWVGWTPVKQGVPNLMKIGLRS